MISPTKSLGAVIALTLQSFFIAVVILFIVVAVMAAARWFGGFWDSLMAYPLRWLIGVWALTFFFFSYQLKGEGKQEASGGAADPGNKKEASGGAADPGVKK